MASAALPSYLRDFNLTFLCFEQLETPNKQNKLIQMRLLLAMTKRHVQGLSANLPVPQTVANKALTFDSLHSKSTNKSWRSRNLSSKLKSRPTPRHHSLNLILPSLSTVRQSPNAGKSLGRFGYNVRIVAPQGWPQLQFDIMRVASDEQQEDVSNNLMALLRLAAKYKWLSVLSFHAAVLDRIEAGLASWGDDSG